MPTSTITAILRRHRLIEPAVPGRTGASSTNVPTTFGMDFKGHIPVGSGGRCHPLTVLDDHSRFSLGVRACADEKTQTVHDHLTSIFRRYGMPDTILVDNGSPWGSDFYHPFTRSPSEPQRRLSSTGRHPGQRRRRGGCGDTSCPSAVEYDTDDQVRSVDINGRISFLGRSLPVGKAFRNRRVALIVLARANHPHPSPLPGL